MMSAAFVFAVRCSFLRFKTGPDAVDKSMVRLITMSTFNVKRSVIAINVQVLDADGGGQHTAIVGEAEHRG